MMTQEQLHQDSLRLGRIFRADMLKEQGDLVTPKQRRFLEIERKAFANLLAFPATE